MLRYFAIVAIAVLFTFGTQECHAQRRGSTRVPNYAQRPTISPYVNLFNNNQGGVNNYFSFVRPMQRQQQFYQQQMTQNQLFRQQGMQPYQQQSYAGGFIPVGGEVQGLLRPSSQGVGQPATAASFFNYSHFYNSPLTGTRR